MGWHFCAIQIKPGGKIVAGRTMNDKKGISGILLYSLCLINRIATRPFVPLVLHSGRNFVVVGQKE